jgi:hypothetical protein
LIDRLRTGASRRRRSTRVFGLLSDANLEANNLLVGRIDTLESVSHNLVKFRPARVNHHPVQRQNKNESKKENETLLCKLFEFFVVLLNFEAINRVARSELFLKN